jgi:acetyl-CoA carboxylase, biotin carboxylase subunit
MQTEMKVLVANRGEIAIRILRACRDLGLPAVAIYSEGDREALHTRYAEEAICIGPTAARDSYLSIPAVMEAARRTGAQAIHPGYGFLSENASFAEAVEAAGLTFIGPDSRTLNMTGDKLAARRVAREAGLPVLPGPDSVVPGPTGSCPDSALELGVHFTGPVLVKAVSGGGGRGIRLVRRPEELADAVAAARREALAAFGDDNVYLEPLVEFARHIEVQILGDGAGQVLCLGERECSVQRRRQKLIEEAPAPSLSAAQRRFIFDAAAKLGRALNYRSLGTVEFLLSPDGSFNFIEINPRIQVEHPVTEMVTGLDLVKEQLMLAQGRTLRLRQDDITLRGSAIEARVLAEAAASSMAGGGSIRAVDVLPSTGEITYLKEPGGPGVRVDSSLYQGMRVTADYDSLLAKVIAWGDSRTNAIQRLRRALQEFQIGGVVTDLDLLLQILGDLEFVAANVHTTFLDDFECRTPEQESVVARDIAAAAALLVHQQRQTLMRSSGGPAPQRRADTAWRITAWREQM